MKKTTKKLLAVIVLMVLLLSTLMVSSQAAEPKYLVMNDATANVGEEVTIEIKAKDSFNIDDMSLTISYDSTKLSLPDETDETPEADRKLVAGEWLKNVSGFTDYNKPSDGTVKFAFAGLDYESLPKDAVIGKMTFKILSVGETTVSMAVQMYDETVGNAEETVTAKVTGTQPVTGIKLNVTSGTLNVGDTTTLVPTVEPDNATSKEVRWSSSDASVAAVSDNGTVTAKAPGTATITARAGNYSATYTVTVKAPITGITLTPATAKILKGQTVTLKVDFEPANTTDDKTVTWSSSDDTIATVENGVVKGLKDGDVTITAKVGNFTKTATVSVNEIPLEGIAINTKDFELEEGSTKQLEILKNPENSTDDMDIVWESSDETIATVDENGLVKGLKPGKATITATANGDFEATVEVTITEKVVTPDPLPGDEPKDEEKPSVLPATGDIAIGLAVVLLIASAAGIFFVVKRNRK